MPFLGPVVATITTDTATLTEPLIYAGSTDTFTVPAGTTTDFASVPQFCTWLVPRMGTVSRAAVLHDWLCQQLENRPQVGVASHVNAGDVAIQLRVNARDTDGILRRVCREEGVPLLRRWLIWTAVRWGALSNPSRRPGWRRDLPAVAGITLLAAPLVLPISLICWLGIGIDALVEKVVK